MDVLTALATSVHVKPGEKQHLVELLEYLTQLASELKSPSQRNSQNLHAYRLKVKTLRYAPQLSDPVKEVELVNMLGNVKDAIGEWHDGEEPTTIASE